MKSMKKMFSIFSLCALLASLLITPASAYSSVSSSSAIPSLDALISGQVAPVNEDSFGNVYVSVERGLEANSSSQNALSSSDVTVDIRQLSDTPDGEEYLLRAYTPLEKSDSSSLGGPLAFLEVTYIRQYIDSHPYAKVLSMRSGWRSTSISNRAMVNLDMTYIALGEYLDDDNTVVAGGTSDKQSRVSYPRMGVANLFVPSDTRFYSEYVGQSSCSARYDVENTSTSKLVEENCGIYVIFGEINIPSPGRGH